MAKFSLDGEALLEQVGALAKRGLNQKQIALELGFKTTTTMLSRLVKASQTTGRRIPSFKPVRGTAGKVVDSVVVTRRGKGDGFGVNLPMEPLARAGIRAGDKLTVRVSKGRIRISR